MLQRTRVLLVSVLSSLSLTLAAGAQPAGETKGQAARGAGGPATAAATPALQKALLTGTLRFSVGGVYP